MPKLHPHDAKLAAIASAPGYWADKRGQVWLIKNVGYINEVQVYVDQRGDGRGYRCVNLIIDDKAVTKKVHRLVYEAFYGSIPSGMHVDHIDHDKRNNCLANLRLRDFSENSADCRKTTRKGCRVLNEHQRMMVAHLLRAGFKTSDVSTLVRIGPSTVRRLKKTC